MIQQMHLYIKNINLKFHKLKHLKALRQFN
jgi:hypothetical protein